jgi:2-polyprenyl-3-methyl-5-hydroxy-6-metoxy-1,4-benzoquinol methylase
MQGTNGTTDANERRDALVEELFEKIIGAMEVATVYLGDRLGLYRALADGGPATSAELAGRTGTHERYAREWLEQQAVAGILEVDDADAEPSSRRYSLPAGHAEVLLDRDSLSYLAPVARFTMGLMRPLPALAEAFRAGEGVPYPDYGADTREGQADANRPMFVNLLGSEWLPAVPDVHERLLADPPARVADIGCGTGWSSISIARAYPRVRVDGYDLDEPSIDLARSNAEQAGVADRVTFHLRDASDPSLEGQYDLATAFECIHDMGRPVEALRTMRRLVGESGAVIVADERVADSFKAPSDDTERLMYGWSVLFCLPTGLADEPSVGTGTVMRQHTLRRYAVEAGYREVEVLPIENDLWRFYRLIP